MKKSLVITATFMMACIVAKGGLNVKTVKYDNLLVKPNINSSDSQNFWPFYTVRLIVNIIDINGNVINNEYCYGQPGTYTGLSQFYDPTGYELVGAIDNGVKLDKIQAENLVIPEFLGDSSETIDYIVKPVKKKSKDEPSKSKDDKSTKNEKKSTDTKQSNVPNVKNDTSNNGANKNNVDKNNTDKKDTHKNETNKSKVNKHDTSNNETNKSKINKSDVDKNDAHKNDTSNNETNKNNTNKNGESKINDRTVKKKSSDTKSLVNSKGKKDGNKSNNNQSESDKTNKYIQHRYEPENEPTKLVKSKLQKIPKIISDSNEQINSGIPANKNIIPYSLDDTKKIIAENSTKNSQNSPKKALIDKKSSNMEVSGIVKVSVDKQIQELNNLKSKDNSPDSTAEKHMFRFEMPIVSMCVTDDSNDTPNSKIQHPDIDKKSSFNTNTTYIKSKGLLIITSLIGIISALSLAVKPKK